MLDYVLQFKEVIEIVINGIVKYILYLLAHKRSGFDSYVVLNNLLQWRTVVGLIRNGLVIVSLKILHGYIDPVKKIPQYVHFRSGLLHNNDSSKKLEEAINYRKVYLNMN